MNKMSNVKFAKILEDRINIIEDSANNSFVEIPVNNLQSRLIKNVENIGLEYLINYQTIRYGDAINMGIYAKELYPYINLSEKYKEIIDENKTIPLIKNKNITYLEKILNSRRSIRKYEKDIMSFDTFSNILHHSQNMKEINGLFF